MSTRVPADSLVGRVILSTRFQPGAVVGLGLTASLLTPICVLIGGPVILAALPLLAITALADSSYALLAARSTSLSRRVLVLEPLAARLSESAWLLALWLLGAPGWAVAATGALCWMYVLTRSRARQVGLRDLGMTTLGERSVREVVVALGFGAAGVIAVAGGGQYEDWIGGAVTITVTGWMLLAALGLLQLVIVVSTALRNG
ncbi:CDP-alcohol phosphatidyltransferase family protein [Glycomyces sp. NRRL B-16210]|uniref:CDP-alcohol phosphatidyltransferase family protein n=1 Tax=Glycomyces sp. NRRL B-16210 TaxID=1463821 RepID=UPI0010608457|nr:CDP-alcohol phosphatidyltransferase family protein [Glycomyces sp. NRRL B-16210]